MSAAAKELRGGRMEIKKLISYPKKIKQNVHGNGVCSYKEQLQLVMVAGKGWPELQNKILKNHNYF